MGWKRLTMVVVAALAAGGCVRWAYSPRDDVSLLVIAPHPDDEVLLATGMVRKALKDGQRVAVVVVTNGDLTCARNGYQREAETIAALGVLGVREADVHFLGYPDGALERLTTQPQAPRERVMVDGGCSLAAGTYANRGFEHVDEHTFRTGHSGDWTSTALAEDLAALISRLAPEEVVVPHGIDSHPDHAATYVYFRRALELLERNTFHVHRGVVHAGRCWPTDCSATFLPDAGWAPLPPPYENYRPRERLSVDARLKFTAISKYPSQTGPIPQSDWLAGFARTEEVYFPETLERVDGLWQRVPFRERFEVMLPEVAGERVTFIVSHAHGGELVDAVVSEERVRLIRQSDSHELASFFRASPGSLKLVVEQEPEDGDLSEWSLWGPDGLIGVRVVSPMVTGVELRAHSSTETPRVGH